MLYTSLGGTENEAHKRTDVRGRQRSDVAEIHRCKPSQDLLEKLRRVVVRKARNLSRLGQGVPGSDYRHSTLQKCQGFYAAYLQAASLSTRDV